MPQTSVHRLRILMIMMAMSLAIGCNSSSDSRLADFAAASSAQQAAQNEHMAELQREVAQGARELIEAENASRQQIISLQRDLQQQSAGVAQQRDELEVERKQLARQRHIAPIIAAAIMDVGILLACILPLVLGYFLLRPTHAHEDEQLAAELLIEDLVSPDPVLISPTPMPRIGVRSTAVDAAPESSGPASFQ